MSEFGGQPTPQQDDDLDRMVLMVDVDVSELLNVKAILKRLHEEFGTIRCAYVGKDEVRDRAIAAFADDPHVKPRLHDGLAGD